MSSNDSDFAEAYRDDPDSRTGKPVTHDEHVSQGFHNMGETLPYADTTQACEPGTPNVGQSKLVAASDHSHSVVLRSTNGLPASADFIEPAVGIMALDVTNNRLYVRCPTGWKYAPLV